jgi:hypothetical protein
MPGLPSSQWLANEIIMRRSIPYPLPPRGLLREISENLQDGRFSGQNADRLLASGIDWALVTLHVHDLSWWNAQKPRQANPPELDWKVRVWGATIRLAVEDTIIWIDPGENTPMPDQDPELVIITHAHFDHTARLAEWARDYPLAQFVMTTSTAELLSLRATGGFEWTSFTSFFDRVICMDFNEPRIISDVHLRFISAGHLFGAAMVEIGYRHDRVLVTGDFALREIGGLPGATIPPGSYGIVLMGVSEARPGSLPFADLKTTRYPFLENVSDAIEQGKGPVLIPVQAFGQAQEAYAALVMAQRAGAFPDIKVYLKGLAASASALYAKSLGQIPGPWAVPYDTVQDVIPDNGVVILSEQDNSINDRASSLDRPILYTHAGWGEQMTFAVGIACDQMYFYHGFNTSLGITLRNLGRKVTVPFTEE